MRGEPLELTGMPAAGRELQHRAVWQPNVRRVCPAEMERRFDQHVENGLQVEGRAADDLEDLRGRGLLVPSLPQFAGEPRDRRFLAGDGVIATARGLPPGALPGRPLKPQRLNSL